MLAVFALGLSVLVTALAYRLLQNRMNPAEDMTRIVVVSHKVGLGARLAPEDLRMAPWPMAAPLQGSFQSLADAIGRGVIVPMAANEPVLESKLAPKDGGAGFTVAIPEGMRAVAVKVNDVIGVAGFVLPGTRVDIIVIGAEQGNGGSDTSKVILENVQVLSAGQNIDQDVNGKPQNVQVVTLLVTPEDAQKLALAAVDGRLQLALRNPMDVKYTNPPAIRRAALYASASGQQLPTAVADKQQNAKDRKAAARKARPTPPPEPLPVVAAAPAPEPPPPPRKLNVELILGSQAKTLTFEEKQPEVKETKKEEKQ